MPLDFTNPTHRALLDRIFIYSSLDTRRAFATCTSHYRNHHRLGRYDRYVRGVMHDCARAARRAHPIHALRSANPGRSASASNDDRSGLSGRSGRSGSSGQVGHSGATHSASTSGLGRTNSSTLFTSHTSRRLNPNRAAQLADCERAVQCYTFRRDRLRSRLRKFPDRCGLDRSPKYDRCCRGMEYYKDDASDLEDEDVSLDVPLRDEMGRLLAVAFDTLGM